MGKSDHKNYVEWFDRNWPLLVKTKIIPHEKKIFELFSQKFSHDAKEDLNRWRKILRELWNLCAASCQEMHNILAWNVENTIELKELVENIVNLDYESLWEVFNEIKASYAAKSKDTEIEKHLNNICESLDKMRDKSKDKTNVISKSE